MGTTQKVPPAIVSCRPPQSELSSVSPLIRCSNMGKIPWEKETLGASLRRYFCVYSLGLGPSFLASDGECHIKGLSNEVVGIRRRCHAVWVGVEFDHAWPDMSQVL